MKFLGEYNSETANVYKDKLEDEEVFPAIEEVGGHFASCWATMGTLRPRIRLFVEDGDYDKAVALIKDLEQNFEKKVEVDGKEADKAMIKVALGILGFLLLTMIIAYFRWQG